MTPYHLVREIHLIASLGLGSRGIYSQRSASPLLTLTINEYASPGEQVLLQNGHEAVWSRVSPRGLLCNDEKWVLIQASVRKFVGPLSQAERMEILS